MDTLGNLQTINIKEAIMTINKLLLGAALVGMLACYGCEEEEKIPVDVVITDSLIVVDGDTTERENPVTGEICLQGETELDIGDSTQDFKYNWLTDDFLVDVIHGLRNGEYWNPGDNQFELELYDAGLGIYRSVFWLNTDITVYGGGGTDDTVAFVGNSKQVLYYGHSETAYFRKDTTSGVSYNGIEIANNTFTETVSPGDYCIVSWVIGAEINQPVAGGFFLTDTISYAICEGLASNTGVPYAHKMRYIYSGATSDTNIRTISIDSFWYSSDTSQVKLILTTTDTSRDGVANDTCLFVDVLDSYNRLWKRDSIGYCFNAGEQLTSTQTFILERDDPETP